MPPWFCENVAAAKCVAEMVHRVISENDFWDYGNYWQAGVYDSEDVENEMLHFLAFMKQIGED